MSKRGRRAVREEAPAPETPPENAIRAQYGIEKWLSDAQYQRRLSRQEELEIYFTPRPKKKSSRIVQEDAMRNQRAVENAIERTWAEERKCLAVLDLCRRMYPLQHGVYQRYVVDGWSQEAVAVWLRTQGVPCDQARVSREKLPLMRETIRTLYRMKYGTEAHPNFPMPPVRAEEAPGEG